MDQSPIVELIALFQHAAREHYAASLKGDAVTATKNADLLEEAFKGIVRYGTEGRQQLLRLVDDDDAVALKAATHSINFNSEKCQRVLKRIAKRSELIGFISQQALKRWKEGSLNFG